MVQVKKDEVRERILRASARLFAERGFARTSLRAIAEEAAVSLANVYNYYEGKDELFEAVLHETLVEVAAGLDAARARDGAELCILPDRERIDALVAFVDRRRFELGMLLFRSEGSRLHHWEDGVVEALTEIWEARVRRTGPDGPSRFLVHHLASWTVQSLAEFVMHDVEVAEMTAHLDELLRFFRAGLPTCLRRED